MRVFCFLMVLVTAVAAFHSSSPAAPGREGAYDLHFSQDAGWHRNGIVIDAIDGETVKGTVEIDRGIGPQARAPMPDERLHRVPFTASLHPATERLTFTVAVGEAKPVKYFFSLFFIATQPGYLAGTVTIGGSESLRDGEKMTVLGVLARKLEKGEK